jgi:hypothetical protein
MALYFSIIVILSLSFDKEYFFNFKLKQKIKKKF